MGTWERRVSRLCVRCARSKHLVFLYLQQTNSQFNLNSPLFWPWCLHKQDMDVWVLPFKPELHSYDNYTSRQGMKYAMKRQVQSIYMGPICSSLSCLRFGSLKLVSSVKDLSIFISNNSTCISCVTIQNPRWNQVRFHFKQFGPQTPRLPRFFPYNIIWLTSSTCKV